MRTSSASTLAVASALCLVGLARTGAAGTQDFTLVNKTGTDIHNLHISESDKNEWEEDILGKKILEDGASIEITFSGKEACLWDMMVKDEEGTGVYWEDINLCKLETVVLHCDKKKCWATGE